MIETPELDRLKTVQDKSQVIGEFLEWIFHTKHFELAQWQPNDKLEPIYRSIEDWLAEYFEINLKKVETEKQAILDSIHRDSKEGEK